MFGLTGEEIKGFVELYALKALIAIVILIIGKIIASFVTKLVKRAMERANLDVTLIGFLGNIVNALLLVFVVIAALNQLGIETTSLAAILAAAGLAVGLALQGSLSNFAAGVILIVLRPFHAGDFVEAGGTVGTVQSVGIFTTTLKTTDNKVIIAPNSKITSDNITNYSAETTRRVDMVFGISYDDDLLKAKDLLTQIIKNDTRVLNDPAPRIAVSELADSSVNFIVRPWVKSEEYWDVFYSITEAVKTTFDKEGITIPYPQRDVHMYEQEKA